MTVAPQADIEVVTGIVQGVVAKAADKWQVEVNTGQQNPRRLWTKDADLVQQMMGLIGQTLSFQCGKSHWTNASNQPVVSLWINGYGQPGAVAPAPAPQTQVPQYQPPVQTQPVIQQVPQADDREEKIHRQTATKVAVHLLKHLSPEDQTFTTLIQLSERLVAYYDRGVAWTPDVVQAAAGDGAPPHTDDDIPF